MIEPNASQQSASPRLALTQEEMRLLLQCNRDAFWQRCLPLMVAFAGSTHMLVKLGYLRPHPTRGSLYKVLASCAVGWMFGKMSFRQECQRRVMEQMPNSRLAETLRLRQMPPAHYQQPGGPLVVPPPKADVDFGPPSLDESQQSQTALSTGSSAVTYDELRRRHHSDAIAQQQQQLARQQEKLRQPIGQPQEEKPAPRQSRSVGERKGRVNKYGDLVEEDEQ